MREEKAKNAKSDATKEAIKTLLDLKKTYKEQVGEVSDFRPFSFFIDVIWTRVAGCEPVRGCGPLLLRNGVFID